VVSIGPPFDIGTTMSQCHTRRNGQSLVNLEG
jgi:hypothetical protein